MKTIRRRKGKKKSGKSHQQQQKKEYKLEELRLRKMFVGL